jgi:hypothetical protein
MGFILSQNQKRETSVDRFPYQHLLVKVINQIMTPLFEGKDPFDGARKLIINEINDQKILESFSRLTESIMESGRMTPFGYIYINGFLKRFVKNRIRLSRLWAINPEILREPIVNPIIILGLPRSGTTFLFNLMANDQRIRYIRNWEVSVSPIPPKRGCHFLVDRRRSIGKILLYTQNLLAPHLRHIHDFMLDGPEECTPIFMYGFATQALDPLFYVSSYSRWLDEVDYLKNYEFHKKVLQTLQWNEKKEFWLLKSPDHIAGIEGLLKIYPDALLIHLHRDPAESVTSWASLNQIFQGICLSKINDASLGQQVLDRLGNDMDRYMKIRGSIPKEQIVDVYYSDLISDPIDTVNKIYQFFGISSSPDRTKQLKDFIFKDENDRRAKFKHKYSPEDFGLSRNRIHDRFRKYIDKFRVSIRTTEDK